MRIISGTAKGRKLYAPPATELRIRPTSDRAREALFSILGHAVRGARVLDLFAGTGAVGLEAYSRGAQTVTFVDYDRLALRLIAQNIEHCFDKESAGRTCRILPHDLARGLPHQLILTNNPGPFDLIFADPPYQEDLALAILQHLDRSELVAPDGIVVIETRFSSRLPAMLETLKNYDRRVYGECTFWFYSPTPITAKSERDDQPA